MPQIDPSVKLYNHGEGPYSGLLRDCENRLWNRWIDLRHSTRTLIFPCQGYVGCLVDTELVHDKHVYSGARSLYYAHDSAAATARVSVAHETLTTRTPDTSFYQWVPFVLVFQVQWE